MLARAHEHAYAIKSKALLVRLLTKKEIDFYFPAT
jgi:hypothetical protein